MTLIVFEFIVLFVLSWTQNKTFTKADPENNQQNSDSENKVNQSSAGQTHESQQHDGTDWKRLLYECDIIVKTNLRIKRVKLQ